MARRDLPARSVGRPPAIDVTAREAVPVPPPVAVPAVPEPEPKPPPRKLSTAELITEGTKLAVGAVVATGRGLRAVVEQAVAIVDEAHADHERPAGGPEAGPASGEPVPAEAAAPPSASPTGAPAGVPTTPAAAAAAPSAGQVTDEDAGERTVAALRAPDEPETVLGALPTALLGAGLHAQRRVMTAVAEGRERYGPAVHWLLDAPLVSSAYQRARANVFAWYRRGATERDEGAELAVASLQELSDEGLGYVFQHLDLNTILRGFDINPLVQNLELSDVILSSTGGLATDALDSVRSQGVTVDDIIARISNRIFRRKPEAVPDGPPGPYGVKQELRPWTSR